jgi:hypothetical protein
MVADEPHHHATSSGLCLLTIFTIVDFWARVPVDVCQQVSFSFGFLSLQSGFAPDTFQCQVLKVTVGWPDAFGTKLNDDKNSE